MYASNHSVPPQYNDALNVINILTNSYCQKCGLKIIKNFCNCPEGPTIYLSKLSLEEQEYFFLDGSVT
jgi:hypothetical protein